MSNKTLMMTVTDSWVSVNAFLNVPVGERITLHNVGVGWGIVLLGGQPLPATDKGVYLTNTDKPSYQLSVPVGSDEVWVRSSGGEPCYLIAQAGTPISFSADGIPMSVLAGRNAITTQTYSEANRKNGDQFVASRKLTATNGQVINSIIQTGTKPIDLKSREFAYSGLGLDADIYEGATYTGGVNDPIYSANGITPNSFDFQLKSGITVTDIGTKFAATIYAFGESSQQSRGSTLTALGSNYILAPNTSYLLRIVSNDNQDISARIEGYNGFLDLPLTSF